ncbi:diacylglycerol/lipid kinase family protein [Metabacillus herbersteinensis]|uniref:Diacylglycerol/lipid kinase family protein n=1 Tax=Metabacillus herbersteinensis TaxID=283816 RepID=A0ABV6G9I6_9BACI
MTSSYFVNNLGVGFDAEVAKMASELSWKKILNGLNIQSLTYVIALIKSIFTYSPSSITLTVDEEIHEFTNVWFVAVSNHPYYGGGMKIAPTANPTDGKLTITTVHNLSRMKLLLLFVTVFFGKHIGLRKVKCVVVKK